MGKSSVTNEQLEEWISSVKVAPEKAKRIEKRLAKKQRREQRKSYQVKTGRRDSSSPSHEVKDPRSTEDLLPSRQSSVSEESLRLLSNQWRAYSTKVQSGKFAKPYVTEEVPKSSAGKRKLNLQPKKSDYGGLGLAKPSLWISLEDLGWKPRLKEEFLEHVPGFFGKQRTKAMKKQLDGDMLWRKRLAEKKRRDTTRALPQR